MRLTDMILDTKVSIARLEERLSRVSVPSACQTRFSVVENRLRILQDDLDSLFLSLELNRSKRDIPNRRKRRAARRERTLENNVGESQRSDAESPIEPPVESNEGNARTDVVSIEGTDYLPVYEPHSELGGDRDRDESIGDLRLPCSDHTEFTESCIECLRLNPRPAHDAFDDDIPF